VLTLRALADRHRTVCDIGARLAKCLHHPLRSVPSGLILLRYKVGCDATLARLYWV